MVNFTITWALRTAPLPSNGWGPRLETSSTKHRKIIELSIMKRTIDAVFAEELISAHL